MELVSRLRGQRPLRRLRARWREQSPIRLERWYHSIRNRFKNRHIHNREDPRPYLLQRYTELSESRLGRWDHHSRFISSRSGQTRPTIWYWWQWQRTLSLALQIVWLATSIR